MKSKYVLGIDIAKESFCFRLEDAGGGLLEQGTCPNQEGAIAGWLERLRGRLGQDLAGLHAGMEATGRYGHKLLEAFWGAGVRASQLNPAQVKYFAASLNRRGKNDPMDAALIARYVRERDPAAILPVGPEIARLKELVGEIETLVAETVRLHNRLAEVGPACAEVASSLGRRQEAARHEIRELENDIGLLLRRCAPLAEDHRLLCSIVGVGSRTASRLLCYLAGKDFQSARQLAAYAGLSPKENTSGTSLRGKTRLCKQGHARLRRALYMPAIVMQSHCPQVAAWSSEIAARTGSKKAAIGAVMRKLAHVIFGVLKHRQPFNPALLEPQTSRP